VRAWLNEAFAVTESSASPNIKLIFRAAINELIKYPSWQGSEGFVGWEAMRALDNLHPVALALFGPHPVPTIQLGHNLRLEARRLPNIDLIGSNK
jgi:hypothetical protein